MKEMEEQILHERHEHAEFEKDRLHALAKKTEHQAQYFKKHENALRAREETFRKERRRFLDAMGRTGISAGLMRAFPAIAGVIGARTATAQTEAKRAVFCYINSGAPNNYWLPKSASQMNLVTEPYAGVASVCNFREVDAMVTGHARATQALGAREYGQPTSDAIAAPVLSANTPFSNMFVGSQTNGAAISTIGQPKSDPYTALNDYFSAGGGDNGGPDMTYLKVYQAQQRAIDEIKAKLSFEEKERLSEHVAAIQKIESRITRFYSDEAIDPQACMPTLPAASSLNQPGVDNNTLNMVVHGKAQVDIIIAGLKCGLTNVATLQLGAETGEWKTFGVDHYQGFSDTSHGSCHAGRTNEEGIPMSFVECQRYISQVPVYLIEQLMSNRGPDGKLLIETTVFAQTTCMGTGEDHTTPNAPFILATQMPGFQTGFSALSQSATGDGTTYDFNDTILKGLGIAGNFDSSNTLSLI